MLLVPVLVTGQVHEYVVFVEGVLRSWLVELGAQKPQFFQFLFEQFPERLFLPTVEVWIEAEPVLVSHSLLSRRL